MRWLLLKDLRILRRSPGLVALLILYPVVLSVLIGFALSTGPDKPKVAVANLVPPSEDVVELGGEQVELSRYQRQLFDAIDPIRIDCADRTALQCRQAAIDEVESGEALAAIVIPEDFATRLGGLQTLALSGPPSIEVFYNADDPVKAAFVEDTIKSQLRDANLALTTRFTEVGLSYLDLVVNGGTIGTSLSGGIELLGLKRAEEVVRKVRPSVPPAQRAELDKVIRFSQLGRENLDFSGPLLRSLTEPIRIEQVALDAGVTSSGSFAVALEAGESL